MDARSWLPRRIPDQRVTIKMIKLHYQDWEHYLGLSLDSRSSCTRQKRNNMQLCHLMEWVRPYIAKGQPFSQAQASWLTPYLFTFPVSQQSCRDEFCFLITVSAKLPLRRGLVKSPESLELGFSVLKSLIKFGIPGIRWGLAWVKRESSPHPGERCLAGGGQTGHFAPKHGQWVKTSLGAERVRRRNVTCYWPTHSSAGFVEQAGDNFNFASPIVSWK